MKRGEFLVKGVLLACSGACAFSACSSGDDGGGAPTPPDNGGNGGGSSNVTVSLSNLSNIGDQVSSNGVLFFRIGTGNTAADFVATESVCPHQGGRLVWQQDNNFIECQLHFARYEEDGDVIRGPQASSGGTRALNVYPTAVSNGNITATVS